MTLGIIAFVMMLVWIITTWAMTRFFDHSSDEKSDHAVLTPDERILFSGFRDLVDR